MKSVIVALTCLVAAASAAYVDVAGVPYAAPAVGMYGWVNGYGFNGFPGVNNGYYNGYHGLDNLNEYNGYNGLVGYNGRHLYNNGYDAGYFNGYNSGSSYSIPHHMASFGFDQPLGGLNGYYAHPEATDVFTNVNGEPVFPNILSAPVGSQQQQQQQQQN